MPGREIRCSDGSPPPAEPPLPRGAPPVGAPPGPAPAPPPAAGPEPLEVTAALVELMADEMAGVRAPEACRLDWAAASAALAVAGVAPLLTMTAWIAASTASAASSPVRPAAAASAEAVWAAAAMALASAWTESWATAADGMAMTPATLATAARLADTAKAESDLRMNPSRVSTRNVHCAPAKGKSAGRISLNYDRGGALPATLRNSLTAQQPPPTRAEAQAASSIKSRQIRYSGDNPSRRRHRRRPTRCCPAVRTRQRRPG